MKTFNDNDLQKLSDIVTSDAIDVKHLGFKKEMLNLPEDDGLSTCEKPGSGSARKEGEDVAILLSRT